MHDALPGSPARRQEAQRLTELLESNRSFTYQRLGDGELGLLIEWQNGQKVHPVRKQLYDPVTGAVSINGLMEQHYGRLLSAYEQAGYLDTFERVPYNRNHLSQLILNRPAENPRSSNPDVSQIFYEWTYLELPGFLRRHRCLIAGAEAPLLRELLSDQRYLSACDGFWPAGHFPACVGIRDRGRNYWMQLERIKSDLASAVRESNADTLFISLASGAKILCDELASELRIRCFDFGAMLLGLTCSATPANQVARNSHNPFFFHVPFNIYMEALARAYPELTPSEVLAKSHAQLCWEMERKAVMNSFQPAVHDPTSFDPNPENRRRFSDAYRQYRAVYRHLSVKAENGRAQTRAFDDWCMKHGIGLSGQFYRVWKAFRTAGWHVQSRFTSMSKKAS